MTASAIPQTDPRAGYLAQQADDRRRDRPRAGRRPYILGREVEAFEAAFADFLGVGHAVGVGSGTDAIELALRACGIGAGDLVFTVSHTAVATVAAIERAGAVAGAGRRRAGHLHDGARASSQRALQLPPPGRPAAVLPVHLYGAAGRPDPLSATRARARAAADRGLRAEPRRALSRPADRIVRRHRVLQLLSDQESGRARRRRHGRRPTTRAGDRGCAKFANMAGASAMSAPGRGINSRLDPIQAAILGVKLAAPRGRQCAPPGHRRPL